MAPNNQKQNQVAAPAAAPTSVDPEQALKASKALIAHIKKASAQKSSSSAKKNILDEIEPDNALALADTPIWLTLTTKRHIADTNRLKPDKIPLPHPLHSNSHETICLITADPQRAYKDIVASDEFPEDLRKRITRVIGYSKVRAKYRQYEAQRQLFNEHDIFLGDDRIINRLPQALGKTFYKTTAKRPVPVVFRSQTRTKKKAAGKKKDEDEEVNAASPGEIAQEINKAISAALVSLSPSTNTAIKVGYASWTPQQVAENVAEVASTLVSKHVPKGWSNVKSIYIKGPETTALPIWQTEELWVDGRDVAPEEEEKPKEIEGGERANIGKKRKALEGQEKKGPLSKKAKNVPESDDADLKKQIAETKTRLRKQKAAAKAAMDD
ncbi:hypothetical protein VUR80DRAFT_3843 [Thermomyces stellatus]